MITRIEAKNYKSLADIAIDLSPLTVLVGRNGAGKSNIVDVLRFVRDILTKGLDNAIMTRHGMSSLRRWSPKGRPFDVSIKLHIEDREGEWSGEYSFTLGSKSRGEYSIKSERGFIKSKDGDEFEIETKDGEWVKEPKFEGLKEVLETEKLPIFTARLIMPIYGQLSSLQEITQVLREMSFYSIFPNALREPQKPLNLYPLNENGDNMASVLRRMRKDKSKNIDEMKETLSKVVGGVTDFNVSQIGGYFVTKLRHEGQTKDGKTPVFELAQESDGTLRMLGILTALYQDPPRSMLAIEEPELTIHSGALGVLCDVIEEVAKKNQVVITSHSTDLIDRFDIESIRVVEMEDGMTKVGSISKKQKESVKELLFSTGELIRIEGLQREKTIQ